MHKEEDIKKAFLWIVEILEKLKVPYQFTGGFAAHSYGSSRVLNDIDLEVPDDEIPKIAQLIKEYIIMGPEEYVDDSWDLNVVTAKYEGLEIDIAGVGAKIFDQNSKKWLPLGSNLSKSDKREIFGKVVPVMPLANLLAYKSKLLRDVDKVDLEYFSKNKVKSKNYAFIDTQNIYLSIKSLGWDIDWYKFRVYLKEHYSISNAYLFIGYIEGNNKLYAKLQEAGFVCIFKPVLAYKDGTIKGNVDAELVLHTMIQFPNFDKAIIVTGDGDFYCLVQYLLDQNKLYTVLVPNMHKYSALLKKFAKKNIAFMNELKEKIGLK